MTHEPRHPAPPIATQEGDQVKDSTIGDRFMVRFSEDTLKHRPLSIRLPSRAEAEGGARR